jgi:hypothetical protein
MATETSTSPTSEAAIIARMIHPEKADLPDDAAQTLLRFKFDQTDLDRMHELAVKNQDDALTPAEKAELESYLRVSYFIDLMHAKARLSLKKHN